MVAREEVMVVGHVETVLVDDGKRVGAVDLRVDDRLQVSGGSVFRPEAEDLEARAGSCVVDDIEGFTFAVVFYA